MATKSVSYIAVVSMCWGFLLSSVAFVSIVWSSNPDEGQLEPVTLKLSCQAAILALGSIQTIFSVVLVLIPKSIKESWITIWICSHIVVVIGLLFFYILQTTYSTLVTSSMNKEASWSPSSFTTLDATILFDFLFLTIFFLSLLCQRPKKSENLTINSQSRPDSNLQSASTLSGQVNSNVLLHGQILGVQSIGMYPYFFENNKV